MRRFIFIFALISCLLGVSCLPPASPSNTTIPPSLFTALPRLAALVDISYCITPALSGLTPPFHCASHCSQFPLVQLIDTFHTGPLSTDSCGYIAVDHGERALLVVWRGSYSLGDLLADLEVAPGEYVPYPSPDDNDDNDDDTPNTPHQTWRSLLYKLTHPWTLWSSPRIEQEEEEEEAEPASLKCTNCTVHLGFLCAWKSTRSLILPTLSRLQLQYPDYEIRLLGHSLGGAVALLAALEMEAFAEEGRYRRVTHVGDPVPLLPLRDWGYRSHAGEIYIAKRELKPEIADVYRCEGPEDERCSSRGAAAGGELGAVLDERALYAHRDYFIRLGLCIPGAGELLEDARAWEEEL
ncbi:hypothetical protein M430DRAFT_157952 [Amorphotheca resinae ATCC 22711]|uniref:Fungal lipase-type domain-containing protein n=1 Tax=Amorphotheca resinae ATCC 22711 TaxID=857342 RepID=A0A2T3BE83_AMORE|nr:hypothetical protein M430DRAFT_157952 [Amorphotheca resinae ATCC 22711]PSS27720.1 hypothetical protein M430DRAFT_157952 [Amorphotheca resinae ATCC 22711]